jgi:hypothetical protein
MTYQSNSGRSVEEHYDDVLPSERFVNSVTSVNTGRTNSARGEGTTTAELVAKFRFLNCCACFLVLLIQVLPIVLNPIRLTLLFSSPIKLMLEFLVALLGLSVFLVEARIPILGEKVMFQIRDFAGGKIRCMDLNVARGRVFALIIMGASISLINYMAVHVKDIVSSSENDGGSPTEIPGAVNNTVTNTTNSSPGSHTGTTMTSDAAFISTMFVVLQCTVFSPVVVILFSLSAYTLSVLRDFPEFAQVRAYEIQDDSDAGASSGASGFTRPSWVSNAFGSARGFDSAGGSGYQSLSV